MAIWIAVMGRHVDKQVSIADAKDHFSEIVQQAERGAVVSMSVPTDYSSMQAIVMSRRMCMSSAMTMSRNSGSILSGCEAAVVFLA